MEGEGFYVVKNEFLTNCLLYGNTKVCCYNQNPFALTLLLKKIAIKVSIFTYFQYFRYHPTLPDVVFFPKLLLKHCKEGISILLYSS